VLGDVAIFVNMDSADVWVHPELLNLTRAEAIRIAGVRPTTFRRPGSAGQSAVSLACAGRAGIRLVDRADSPRCELYDIVRLDHFRGFEAYWAIPAAEKTAVNGSG